ncbi:FAD-dependent monooxygenase [Nocardia sp. CA-084685]|uniref:FAD-dependent monooxygenase n=1 Tax=Nocardia sp. CA-084685 TaxID=3239970 RepID=UPI003D98D773
MADSDMNGDENFCDTEVLVVGAGLAGLAVGAFAALHGTQVLVAERHAGTARHPKARLVNARSMELYTALGVLEQVRAAGEEQGGFAVAERLVDEHTAWIPPAEPTSEATDLAAVQQYSCDQQRLEPILYRRAVELGARVSFETTVADLVETRDAVTARLVRPDGTSRRVRARYVVAADGARSSIRGLRGIGWRGEPVPGTAVSALFRADLEPALRGRRADAIFLRSAESFLFARGDADQRRWQLGTYLRPDWDPDDTATLRRRLTTILRAATGLDELRPEIEDVLTWTAGAYLADRYRDGRVLLLGDAAHTMPQYGGLGGNTAVQDAHNLAWKLAAVCRGDAPACLLDTYERERRPLGALTIAQAVLRAGKVPGHPDPPGQIDTATLTLGFRYPQNGSPDIAPDALVENPATPSGDPGTRAPHIALCDGGSLLALLDPTSFTFIHDTHHPPPGPVAGITDRTILLDNVAMARRARFTAAYRVGALIRPDGVIAWRTTVPASTDDLRAAVDDAWHRHCEAR